MSTAADATVTITGLQEDEVRVVSGLFLARSLWYYTVTVTFNSADTGWGTSLLSSKCDQSGSNLPSQDPRDTQQIRDHNNLPPDHLACSFSFHETQSCLLLLNYVTDTSTQKDLLQLSFLEKPTEEDVSAFVLDKLT